MKHPLSITLIVPALDQAWHAASCEQSPRATIVPTLDLEAYAQAVGSGMPDASDTAAFAPVGQFEADEATTIRPTYATIFPAFDLASFARQSVIETLSPPSFAAVPSDGSFDETAVPSRGPHAGEALDHRAAFVLLHVDGVSTLGEIAKSCMVPQEEALRILSDLLDRGVLRLQKIRSVVPSSSIRELAGSHGDTESEETGSDESYELALVASR